jgi:hypothetical protein
MQEALVVTDAVIFDKLMVGQLVTGSGMAPGTRIALILDGSAV